MPYKSREKRKEHYQANRERMRTEHREQAKGHRIRYPDTYEDEKARAIKRARLAKIETMTHYGGGRCACVKCGESRLACLSIDHLNGRKSVEHYNKRLCGRNLYAWLRVHNYPGGYQTLCMNCQWIKRCENNETRWGEYGIASIGGATKLAIVEVVS